VRDVSCTSLIFRRPIPDDWERVTVAMARWWDGRDPGALLPRIFFEHFRGTSLLVEHEDWLVGFLVGFFCTDHPDEACVHVVAVDPAWRRVGLAGDLYRRFFALARANGRTVVRATTAAADSDSIAFHTALGFSLLPGDTAVGGVPSSCDSGPQFDHLVRFQLLLGAEVGARVSGDQTSHAAPTAGGATSDITWRSADPGDAKAVARAIDDWWLGRHMVHAVCPQLFEHLGDTCVIAEADGELIGFLVGFASQRLPETGYVHYAGVHPGRRGLGIGREMYGRFADSMRAHGCTRLCAETGTWNVESIAFHRSIGFELEPGSDVVDGLPVHHDGAGVGFDFVVMVMPLDGGDHP
jgi:GNAT superfamily N-acetyltransferase